MDPFLGELQAGTGNSYAKITVRRTEENVKSVRESYVKKLKDNYLLILRTLLHDIILTADPEGNLVFVNDAAVEFFGVSRKKLIGTHFAQYLHPDDVEKSVAAIQELVEKKSQVKSFIIRLKSPTGFRKVAWNGVAIFDDEGNYVGAQATGKDITDILRAEEELKQSKQQLNTLFEVMVDPIIIVDINGSILEVSQSAENILGFPKSELGGKHFLETNAAAVESKALLAKNLEQIKKGVYIQPYPIEAVTKDGRKLLYELNTARITYKNEPAILGIFRNITDQKKAEEKLHASEERFRYFIENAPEAIWVQDFTGTFIDGNKRAEEITGYDRAELIGKNMLETNFVKEDYIPRVLEAFKTNQRGERSGPTELELRKKDGSLIFVEASSIPVEREGKIEIIGIARDITDRKKAEDALRESEKRFRDLSELLPEIVFETDATGTLTFLNNAAFDYSGYSQEDFEKGLNALRVIFPKDRDKAQKNMGKIFRGEKVGPNEYSALRKDGSTFPIIIHTTPITRENVVVGMRGIIVDITDRKKAEEALKKSEERFRSTLDGMMEGCQIMDYDWRYIYINDAAIKNGRLKKKGLLGKTLLEMYPGIETTEVFSVFSKCMKERVPANIKNEFTFPNGEKGWFELSIDPVPEGIFILSVDITDRKEVEEALRREREMLENVTANINAGLAVISKDYHVLWVNHVLKGYLGEIEGKSCYSSLNNRKDICPNCGVKEIFETGKDVVIHDQQVSSPIGEIWLEITATAIRDESGEIVAASEMSVDITERKRIELELRESLEKFKTIFEGGTDGIVAADIETHKFVFANPRMYDLTGYSLGELPQLGVADIVPPEDLAFAMDQFQKQLEGQIPITRNVALLRKDKSKVYCDISSRAMTIGNKQYLIGFFRDVTEQKKVEDTLKESEEKFRTIFEGATDGIGAVDPKTMRFAFANSRLSELLGFSPDELLKLTIIDLIPKETIPFVTDQFQKQMMGKITATRNVAILRKDKSIIYGDISSKLMTIGNQKYMVSFFRDVTEQKKAQDALLESEKKYRELINGMNDTSIVIDFDGKIIDANKTAIKVLGYSRKELLSAGPEQFDSVLTKQQVTGLVKKMKARKLMVFETLHKTKNGNTFPVEISSSLVTYQGKPAILSIARDITERKKTQEVITRANNLLQQSNMELESYTYVVSHDLKAPLRTIRSFGAFILEDYADKLDDTGKDYLNRMVNASSHMNTMIEDLLVLSRVGRKFTEFEKVDLNKLLDEILADLEASIKEHKTEVAVSSLPRLYIQRTWIRQLFMNLISNALKFNESKNPKIEVLHEATESSHLFKVRDNGIGIEKKYLDRIFNLFERAPTEKKYDGTGAGLAICKKIVEHFGGKIWVESTPGKGSTFIFTIPKEALKHAKET